MNETAGTVIWAAVCFCVAIVVFFCFKFIGKRGADENNRRARDLNDRAGEDNRSLEEKERRTRELIEESKAEIGRADDLIGRQADDYRTAEKNNRRAKELIGKAKDILADDN
jgi:hypothetical protein